MSHAGIILQRGPSVCKLSKFARLEVVLAYSANIAHVLAYSENIPQLFSRA